MTVLEATKSKNSSGVSRSSRLFVLELSGDRIHSMNPDGSDRKTIVTDCRFPDGIVVDVQAGHIYWTNMGIPNLNDGSIERADLNGGNRKVIVPQGVTHTPSPRRRRWERIRGRPTRESCRGLPTPSGRCLCRAARANPNG